MTRIASQLGITLDSGCNRRHLISNYCIQLNTYYNCLIEDIEIIAFHQ